MNYSLKETRINRVVKDRVGNIESTFLLFSDGRYALILEDYVLSGLDIDRDVVIPTFYTEPSNISRGSPILDKLYVIKDGKLRPQLPGLTAQDISVAAYVDHNDGRLKLVTYLSEDKRIQLLCETFGEQWSVSYECHENILGVKSKKCVLKCCLPISSDIEKYVSVVDFNVKDNVRTDIVCSAVCAAAGIDHGIYADRLLADDPDTEIVTDEKGLTVCRSHYQTESLAFDENGGVSVAIKNTKTGKIVFKGRL